MVWGSKARVLETKHAARRQTLQLLMRDKSKINSTHQQVLFFRPGATTFHADSGRLVLEIRMKFCASMSDLDLGGENCVDG